MKLPGTVVAFTSLFGVALAEWQAGDGLFDGFDGTDLSPEWKKAKKNWGGQVSGTLSYNGGVMPENVFVGNGKLRLEAHGNSYSGSLKGINKNLCPREDGFRVGAAVATERYFASGRYEVRARIAPEMGVASAFWTFHYQEYYEGDEQYIAKPVGAKKGYYAINHEIDLEFPGRPDPAIRDISFDRALMNSWVGENDDEHLASPVKMESAQNDGEFHTYRFDWHTGSDTEAQRVEFFVDGTLTRVITKYVPTLASRFWIGAWFPRGWAGTPNFDTTDMEVDWVRITPFNEAGDDWSTAETFPDDGWEDSTLTCTGGGPNQPTLPPIETFETYTAENLGVNVFGGENFVAHDSQESCSGDQSPASKGSTELRFRGNNKYLRFYFSVVENTICLYEYAAFSLLIASAYRDMSGATGVRFDIRSDGVESVKLTIKANTASPCLGQQKKNEMHVNVPVSTDWTQQQVLLSDMDDYVEACPFGPTDMTDIGSLVFGFTEKGASGSLDLDNIEFF